MREMVESCEKLCEAFEEIDDEVLGKLREYKKVSKAATVANIRLHYYITKRYYKVCDLRVYLGFDQLNFLLTNEKSNWNSLNKEEKCALLRHRYNIIENVMVFY